MVHTLIWLLMVLLLVQDLTITTPDNGGNWNEYNFSVEIGDVVATTWTSVSSWESASMDFMILQEIW